MDEIINLVNNVGVPVAMLFYFVWRDSKLCTKIENTLEVIKAFLEKDERED